MPDQLTALVATDWKVLTTVSVLTLLALILVARSVRKLAKVKGLTEKMVAPVMLGGMIWSAEAVWALTEGVAFGLRIATFAVLEFMLLIAMSRAKECMRTDGHPGRSGQTAWIIASAIAFVAFVAGIFLYHSFVEAVLRPAIPLLLTKVWWDGILGNGPRKTGSFKWTPRNLLILMGAIEADDRDVKTVNRDRLIQRMTTLYYDSLYGPDGKREKLRSRLARLTLDADDEIIRAVQLRVRRTSWTTATPLPYDVTQTGDAPADADATQPDAADDAPRDAGVALPPKRRIKGMTQGATSGDAPDADPATQAASLVLTQGMSTREAAKKVGGVSASTVLRRIEKLRATHPDAPADAALTHPPINRRPVLAEGAN